MKEHDYRTTKDPYWSFYVVDDKNTADNVYIFDTAEEAIQKYKEIPADKPSSIGSILKGMVMCDHVQRHSKESMYISEWERQKSSLNWENSPVIQEALDKMISELHITHELDREILGEDLPPIGIPLNRGNREKPDPFHSDRILCTNSFNKTSVLDSINEFHVENIGWLPSKVFYAIVMNSKDIPPFVVDKINAEYITDRGYGGKFDLSPEQFRFMKEKSEPVLREAMYYVERKDWAKLRYMFKEAFEQKLSPLEQKIKAIQQNAAPKAPGNPGKMQLKGGPERE